MFCNSTGQAFDIFCHILPDKTTITLADAQDLCFKKIETELIALEDIYETNVEAVDSVVVDSTAVQEVIIPKDLPLRELN